MATNHHVRIETMNNENHAKNESSPSLIRQIPEKLQAKDSVEMRSTASDAVIADSRPPEHDTSWRPSIVRIGPIVGLVALLFAFLQIFASYAVLKASNKAPITTWRYQPQVLLAILVAISNKAVAFALVQGVAVTFWLRALKGTTIGQLHRDWAYGLHTYKALMAGKNFSVLALACVCTTLVAMDGPLLQRASTVGQRVPSEPESLFVNIIPEVPAYSTGAVDYSNLPVSESIAYRNRFRPVYKGYERNRPIQGGIVGCGGTCEATVHAPALALDYCVSSLEYNDFLRPLNSTEQLWLAEGCIAAEPYKYVFKTEFELYKDPFERVNITTMISGHQVAKSCKGPINVTSCIYSSAIGEYKISVQNESMSFVEAPSSPNIIARANNTVVTHKAVAKDGLLSIAEDYPSTLAGIVYVGLIYWKWNQQLVMTPGANKRAGPSLWPIPSPSITQYITNNHEWGRSDCAPAWRDPRDDIVAGLNELMFRTGVHFAQLPEFQDKDFLRKRLDAGLNVNHTISSRRTDEVTVYLSDFTYFAGAATVELFTILIVLYTFYGWWRLGRDASLSPLETAKAFDAPLLAHAPSNSNGREIARLEDSRRVQYGALINETEVDEPSGEKAEKLVMDDSHRVRKPAGERVGLKENFEVLSDRLRAIRRRHEEV